jgi:hypothetical protein
MQAAPQVEEGARMSTLGTESRPAVGSRGPETWVGFQVYGRDGRIGTVECMVTDGGRQGLAVRSGLLVQCCELVPLDRVSAVFHRRSRLLLDGEPAGTP